MNTELLEGAILFILFILIIRHLSPKKRRLTSNDIDKLHDRALVIQSPSPIITEDLGFSKNATKTAEEQKDQQEKNEWVLSQLIDAGECKSLKDLTNEKPIKEIGYYDLLSCLVASQLIMGPALK